MRERDELRLRTVVQVAFDPAQLGGGMIHRVRARGLQLTDPLLQLGVLRARPATGWSRRRSATAVAIPTSPAGRNGNAINAASWTAKPMVCTSSSQARSRQVARSLSRKRSRANSPPVMATG